MFELAKVLFFCLIFFYSCRDKIPPKPCTNSEGWFIKGKHYIDSKLLDENKHWNYKKWQEHQEKELSFITKKDCVPIQKNSNFEKKIELINSTIDLER